MAAPTVIIATRFGANPGNSNLLANPTTAATGPTGEIYLLPTMAQNAQAIFKVLSTCVATVEASCDPIATLKADAANGDWKAVSAALTGVTAGAIILAQIPLGVTALRINVGTLLAGNQAFLKIGTTNTLF